MSPSVAVTVVTAVLFSGMEIEALPPPPLLVITGALSLTPVMVMAKLAEEVLPAPSSTVNEKLSAVFSPPLWV
jgi:hypothetical protein